MKSVLIFLLTVVSIGLRAQITSTFDTNADGWTYMSNVTPVTVDHQSSGGNTGSFVSVTYSSNAGLTVQNWIAPAKFRGNHLARSLGMNLIFSLQQSQAGTTSGFDVVIRTSGFSITYTLPVKPAVAPAWSTYTLSLDESTPWKYNGSATPATRNQIKSVLSNITSIEIRGAYATNAAYTSGLDNVILEQRALTPAPVVTSLSATSGKPGDVITINGSGFNTSPVANTVSFGITGIKAIVQSASATQLTVTVPQNASYGPIVVTNTATGLSTTTSPFTPVFEGGGRIIPASFKPKFDITTILIEDISVTDIDGDGWNDLVVTNNFSDFVIDIYRNLGAGGTLSDASFGPKVSIAVPGNSANGAGLRFADMDGDGKTDAITSNAAAGFVGVYVTLRNTSTPGNISFEAPEYWPGASDESPISFVADLDSDGRLDLMSGEGAIPGAFWFNQNISTPGNIEFGSAVIPFDLTVLNGFKEARAGDLNGDGKPELIISNGQGNVIDVLQNASTPGTPSFLEAFQFSTNQYNGSICIDDMNQDGKNDLLYKVSGEVGIHLRLNTDADGTLTAADFATDVIITGDLAGSGGITIADINGDGKADIVATDNSDAGVYENVYDGGVFDASAFVPAYQYEGNGLNTMPLAPVVADLNGDHRPDVIMGVTNTSPDRLSIYENQNIHAPVISLHTVSPLAGTVGSTVTITGNNFSTVPSKNTVWFGSVKATVLTAAANQLTVTVPPGAGYDAVSVTKDELTSKYHLPFQTTFSSGVTFDTHFASPVEFPLAGADYDLVVGDLDNDGRPDIVAEGGTTLASRFRNTHTSGPITTASLTANGTNTNIRYPRLQDLDGDGYLDVVAANRVLKNNSTTGNISFLADVTIANVNSFGFVDFGDLNRDGKTDIAVTDASLTVDVVENRTANLTGNFVTGTFSSFAPGANIARPGANGNVVIGDFDNDGHPDMITTNPAVDNISILRNAGQHRVSTTSFIASVEFATGDAPNRIYTGDFDRDGKLDVFINHSAGTTPTLLILLHNQSTPGNISFNRIDLTNPTATTTATVADLDGDGKPEIITTSESGNRFSIFKNIHSTGALTNASFAAPYNITVTAPRGITTGDLNLDGKPEIIITRAAGFVAVYENLVSLPPTITSFLPASGPVGTTVTITGTNFSTTPANNIVQFNGTTATVTASTATSITTTVPSGATSGKITVTVAGNTATSATDFTVTLPLPTITSFSPTSGVVGTTVTITGTNFSATPGNNTVRFNGTLTTATASTATSITTTVPAGATTGKITVTVGSNTATSATNFTVLCGLVPTITSFSPVSGTTGTTVTITGTNFSTTPANNTVDFNGTIAEVTASTVTTITTKVPTGASTGPISVQVACNTATSAADFTIKKTIAITTQPTETAVCTGNIATVFTAATGADNLSYQWQFSPDGVVAFADIVDGTEYSGATTSTLSVNTQGDFGVGRYRCAIDGDDADPVITIDVALSLLTTACAPQITIAPLVTKPGGTVTLDLKPLITTNGVLDVNSITVKTGPASGAVATVQDGVLTVDYQGLLFSGSEPLTIEACNTNGICSRQDFTVEVVADIVVYNAVSANGDDENPIFRLEFIDALETTKSNTVTIYNRWGDEVFTVSDYDNKTRAFAGYTTGGQKLPSGIYFYKIILPLQGKTLTGFLALR